MADSRRGEREIKSNNMNKFIGSLILFILIGCNQTPKMGEGIAKSAGSQRAKIDKAFISIRIGVPL